MEDTPAKGRHDTTRDGKHLHGVSLLLQAWMEGRNGLSFFNDRRPLVKNGP